MIRISLGYPIRQLGRILATCFCLCVASVAIASSDIARFVGDYSGYSEVVQNDGSTMPRDLSVSIAETRKGFSVKWATITHRPSGRTKESTYDISFVPSDRAGVFAAAMKKNVFGHEVQLDPMKGEPYVWARIDDDTLTVFSLFVNAEGGYELQQFDRTLARGGLMLNFTRISNGEEKRTITAFLDRID